MPFSELERKRIEQTVGVFCGRHSPAHLKDKLRLDYAVKGHDVVIVERRPRWDNESEWTESPVAKLKFIRSANKWRLYWMRADMKWHGYRGSHRVIASMTWCKRSILTLWRVFSGEFGELFGSLLLAKLDFRT